MKNYNLNTIGNAEIDKFALMAYGAIHNQYNNLGDVTKINFDELYENYGNIEFLVAGPPCQDFSSSGSQQGVSWTCQCGHNYNPLEIPPEKRDTCPNCHSSDNIFKTRSSLIIYYMKAIRILKPKVTIFENVANLVKSSKYNKSFCYIKSEIESYGYNFYYKIINAKNFGIPQNRERVIVVAIRKDIDNGRFKFPEPIEMMCINDLLDDNSALFADTDEDILIDDTISPYVQRNIEREKEQIICSDKAIYRPHCTSGFQDNAIGIQYAPALRAQNPNTIVLQKMNINGTNKYYIKRLTPVEAFRFMGFTDEDYYHASSCVSKSQLYKQAGNSIVVNAAQAVLQEIFNAMPFLFENGRMFHMFSGIGAFEKAARNVAAAMNSRVSYDNYTLNKGLSKDETPSRLGYSCLNSEDNAA